MFLNKVSGSAKSVVVEAAPSAVASLSSGVGVGVVVSGLGFLSPVPVVGVRCTNPLGGFCAPDGVEPVAGVCVAGVGLVGPVGPVGAPPRFGVGVGELAAAFLRASTRMSLDFLIAASTVLLSEL